MYDPWSVQNILNSYNMHRPLSDMNRNWVDPMNVEAERDVQMPVSQTAAWQKWFKAPTGVAEPLKNVIARQPTGPMSQPALPSSNPSVASQIGQQQMQPQFAQGSFAQDTFRGVGKDGSLSFSNI